MHYQARETDSAFTTTKKDKRLMKHSLLMSKVRDSGVKKEKRRRPSKKLITNLESLEDAIEEVEDSTVATPKLKNVREGRGHAKRREKIVKEERQRFGQNMAILTAAAQTSTGAAAPGNRFAALRAHIQANAAKSASATG